MLRWFCISQSENEFSSPQTDVSVVTLFCTQEHGLLLQDCLPKPSGLQALLAVDVPYYYFSCKVRREHCNTVSTLWWLLGLFQIAEV